MFFPDDYVVALNMTPDFDFSFCLLRESVVNKLPLCEDCSAQQKERYTNLEQLVGLSRARVPRICMYMIYSLPRRPITEPKTKQN